MQSEHADQNSQLAFFRKTLLNWFNANGRKYPWRNEKETYRILMAEMMLQRTRVNQVLPIYLEFIKRFPDVESVAEAKEEDISFFIAKLGLLWRSKIIKEMARSILTEHGNRIPSERTELLKVPGIGDYIADAMIVFAFNGKRTVIDSNVVRVVSRFFGIETKGEMRRNRKFIEFCQKISDNLGTDVKQLNWGLIDHSAAICKPVPLCQMCPLSRKCNYYKAKKLIVRREQLQSGGNC